MKRTNAIFYRSFANSFWNQIFLHRSNFFGCPQRDWTYCCNFGIRFLASLTWCTTLFQLKIWWGLLCLDTDGKWRAGMFLETVFGMLESFMYFWDAYFPLLMLSCCSFIFFVWGSYNQKLLFLFYQRRILFSLLKKTRKEKKR